MRIPRDRKNHKLTLSQGEYIEKVLERFRMQNAKPVSTPLAIHFKLTKEMCRIMNLYFSIYSTWLLILSYLHEVHEVHMNGN